MTDVLTASRATGDLSTNACSLLFSDIEGSTTLLQHIGDDFGPLLRRHQAIVRENVERFGGREIDTQGDSFFILFRTAAEAVGAAVAIQRALAAEPWVRGVDVRVRIGIHDGVVRMLEGQCVGLDVHRAARICAAGHGGQIVLSRSAAKEIPEAELERSGVRLRRLGRHRLKDIRYPEDLLDVEDPTLDCDFPPLRSLGAHRTNIAAPRGPIIGRDTEVAEILRLLDEHPGRLVTVIGTGGTGKTAVAERVASLAMDRYSDGIYFVDLGPVGEADLVLPAIAQAMGVRDFPGRPVELDIAASIGESRQLLVLDTFEHVLGAAPGVARLLADCPQLRMLATSRATLGLSAECEYPLEPLALPEPDAAHPEETAAMALFVERILAADPQFTLDDTNRQTVAEIVRRLEGIPLALELAAARLKLLTPAQLLERLTARFQMLRSSRREVQRHRTLREAIDWSNDLLDEEERTVFQRLSVFSGGFKLDDAESVLLFCADLDVDVLEAVGSLVSKSLVHRKLVNGEPRFGMYDMIRDYALEAVRKDGALEDMQRCHLECYTRIAEESGAMALNRDQRRHVIRLTEEADNLRAAFRFALESGDVEACGRLALALHWYWISQGLFTEGLSWLSQSAELASRSQGSDAAARIHLATAWTKACAGDYLGAFPHGRQAEEGFAALGHTDREKQAALIHAICAATAGELEDPGPVLMRCLEHMQQTGDDYFTALGLIVLGEGARMEGERQAAEECYGNALAILDRIGNTFWPGLLKQNIAHFRLASGDADAAVALFAEAYDLGEEFDYPIVVNLCVAGFGGVALARGDAATAARLLGGVDHNMGIIGASFEPADKADIDGYVTRTREALGDAEYDRLAAEGAAQSWDTLRAGARGLAG